MELIKRFRRIPERVNAIMWPLRTEYPTEVEYEKECAAILDFVANNGGTVVHDSSGRGIRTNDKRVVIPRAGDRIVFYPNAVEVVPAREFTPEWEEEVVPQPENVTVNAADPFMSAEIPAEEWKKTMGRIQVIPEPPTVTQLLSCTFCYTERGMDGHWNPASFVINGQSVCIPHADKAIEEA